MTKSNDRNGAAKFALYREAHERMGMTTDEAADGLGMSRRRYEALETHPERMDPATGVLLGSMLGINTHELTEALGDYFVAIGAREA